MNHRYQAKLPGEAIDPQKKLLIRRIDDRRLFALRTRGQRLQRIVALWPRQLRVAAPRGPRFGIPVRIKERLSR